MLERSAAASWERKLRQHHRVMGRTNALVDLVRQAENREMLLCTAVAMMRPYYSSMTSAKYSILKGIKGGKLYPALRLYRPRYEGSEPRIRWLPPEERK